MPLFKMPYHDCVKFWMVAGPLWLVALAALFGALILTENSDIYIHDTYMVLAKTHVILGIVLLLLLPLSFLTIRHFRSTNVKRTNR